MSVECLITGCLLHIPDEGRAVWGDLHKVGENTLAFNAVIEGPYFTPRWQYENEGELTDERVAALPAVIALSDDHGPFYWEKRGVIVLDIRHCQFNQPALARMSTRYNPPGASNVPSA